MPKFKLEPLLQHRKHVEEFHQRELAEALQAVEAEKKTLRQLETNRDRIQTDLEQKMANDMAAADMLTYHKYLDKLALDIAAQMTRVAAAEEQFEQKRMELAQASKNRKIMDKLKDKQLAADIERQQKQEQIFLDEVAIGRHIRSSK